MYKTLLLLAFIFSTTSLSYGQTTTLSGKVSDQNTGEPILFGNVALYKEGKLLTGVETDFDGNYHFAKMDPGIYDVEASYVGYQKTRTTNVQVFSGQSNYLNIAIEEGSGIHLSEVVVIEYQKPLIKSNCTSQGGFVTSEEIKNLPVRSINGLAGTSTGVSSGDGDALAIRGSRTEKTVYYVDGILTKSPSTPHSKQKVKEARVKEELPRSGQLTAGEWNDLTHWDDWQKLLKNETFSSMQDHWKIYPKNRYPVFITNKYDLPIANCKVELINTADEVIWQAYTDNSGSAELWSGVFGIESKAKEINLSYQGQNFKIENPTAIESAVNHYKIPYECEHSNEVEVMFVVDATGSMRDEINYLRSEISDVIHTVTQTEEDTKLKTGAIFYGDYETDFVVKSSPLNINSEECISFIKNEDAVQGGRNPSTPEAVELGLEEALSQKWSETAATKIIFLILDAPPHHNEEVISILQAQIIQAASMGIKIIPVSASSLNREGEFLLKFMALLTNGTYVFLTDDSGIGNEHLKPVHNEYKVETLNDLLIRLILNYSESVSCNLLENKEKIMQSPRLFPNPASTKSKLKLREKADLVTLHASSGKLIHTYRNPKKDLDIECENLLAGIYTICIYTGDKKEIERLVIIGN